MHGPSPAAFDSADSVPASYLDQRKVDRAVAQVARQVIARLARLDFAKAEYLLVELGGFFEILYFQCQMHDAVHAASFK